jgi:DNA-binding IscR family transcriptional regulator
MNLDSRLSSALHALLHMAGRPGPVTSEELGRCMQANPVVVRRTMAGLRRAGLVRTEKGRGGGWSIHRELSVITVRDVHAALGDPSVFAVGLRNRRPECLVEQAVNGVLEGALGEAEALLMERLGAVTLATLADDLQHRMRAHGRHDGAHPSSE